MQLDNCGQLHFISTYCKLSSYDCDVSTLFSVLLYCECVISVGIQWCILNKSVIDNS